MSVAIHSPIESAPVPMSTECTIYWDYHSVPLPSHPSTIAAIVDDLKHGIELRVRHQMEHTIHLYIRQDQMTPPLSKGVQQCGIIPIVTPNKSRMIGDIPLKLYLRKTNQSQVIVVVTRDPDFSYLLRQIRGTSVVPHLFLVFLDDVPPVSSLSDAVDGVIMLRVHHHPHQHGHLYDIQGLQQQELHELSALPDFPLSSDGDEDPTLPPMHDFDPIMIRDIGLLPLPSDPSISPHSPPLISSHLNAIPSPNNSKSNRNPFERNGINLINGYRLQITNAWSPWDTFVITVTPSSTVHDIRLRVYQQHKVRFPTKQIAEYVLVFGGHEMVDEYFLAEYGLNDDDTIMWYHDADIPHLEDEMSQKEMHLVDHRNVSSNENEHKSESPKSPRSASNQRVNENHENDEIHEIDKMQAMDSRDSMEGVEQVPNDKNERKKEIESKSMEVHFKWVGRNAPVSDDAKDRDFTITLKPKSQLNSLHRTIEQDYLPKRFQGKKSLRLHFKGKTLACSRSTLHQAGIRDGDVVTVSIQPRRKKKESRSDKRKSNNQKEKRTSKDSKGAKSSKGELEGMKKIFLQIEGDPETLIPYKVQNRHNIGQLKYFLRKNLISPWNARRTMLTLERENGRLLTQHDIMGDWLEDGDVVVMADGRKHGIAKRRKTIKRVRRSKAAVGEPQWTKKDQKRRASC